MTEPLSIVSWKWHPTPGVASTKKIMEFTSEDVNSLLIMLKKHVHIPFRLICVTDDPAGLSPEIKVVPIWKELSDVGGCFVRINAFRPDIADLFGPRFVSMDLDCVIVRDITNLLSRTEPFVIWHRKGEKSKYCGSMWMMDSGCRSSVFEDFDEKWYRENRSRYKAYGSDQFHISKFLSNEAVWTSKDGVLNFRSFARNRSSRLPASARIVFFNGKYHPRSYSLQQSFPWIRRNYPTLSTEKNELEEVKIMRSPARSQNVINVVCFYWVGKTGSGWENVVLGAEYVNRLFRGVSRNLTKPFKFTCFVQKGVDLPDLDPGINVKHFSSPSWSGRLSKLYAFSKDNELTGRVVVMDLDLVVTGNLNTLFSYKGEFMTRGYPKNLQKSGGDLVFFEAGRFPFWEDFVNNTRRVLDRTRGNERYYYRQTFGSKMNFVQIEYPGVMMSYKREVDGRLESIPSSCSLVSCHGHPRPHELTNLDWVKENWK